MLFERQRLLLTLVDALGSPVAQTDFQKLLFLYTKECETTPSYDFVPYRFGSFSFTSYADKRRLIERGLLEETPQHWSLSESGRKIARQTRSFSAKVSSFVSKHGSLRGTPLVRKVYRSHPYYATRSEIVVNILPSADDLAAVEKSRPRRKGPGLVTIGYEGKTVESYLNQLLRDSVTLLCDVRRNPLSRKYGFSKSTLRNACEHVGITYQHLPELGIPSEERRELKSQADYDALFESYEKDSLPLQGEALTKIHMWIEEGHRVALTCYEAESCQCHRHCVAEALEKAFRPLAAVHL